jgi:hypothetical protein
MSAKIKKIGTLQIESEATHIDPIISSLQVSGFILICLIWFFAFIGLLGSGFISQTRIKNAFFEIEYLKFARIQATYLFNFQINNFPKSKSMTIWITNEFFKKNIVRNIIPQPIMEEMFNNGIRYTFRSDSENSNIIFVLEPEKFGFLTYEISVNNGDKIKINQLIYP